MNYHKSLVVLCMVISSIYAMSDLPCKEKNKMHDRLRVKLEGKKKIVDLSGIGLTDDDIKDIDTLQVEYSGQMVPMRSLPSFSILLNNNELTTLPESLGNIQNLQYLDVKNNRLTVMPDAISRLINSIFLDLSNNQITKLSDTIGNLIKLKFLNLNHNKLESLPQSVAQLKSLKFLNLNSNAFKIVPDVLAQLPSLSVLNLSDNLFEKEPNQCIGQLVRAPDAMVWKKSGTEKIDS